MNATLHFIRHYFRRFWIGMLLFWIVSGGLSAVLFLDGNSEVISRLKAAEILMVLLVVFRLIAAESILRTTNGWHMRPVAKRELSRARGCLMIAVLLPPLLARAWVWLVKAGPNLKNAFDLAWSDLLPLAVFVAIVVLMLRLATKFRAREKVGLWLLLIVPLVVMLVAFWIDRTSFTGSHWSRVPDVRALPRSVGDVMPEGDRRIGPPPLVDGSEAEVLMKLPMGGSHKRLLDVGYRLEQVRLDNKEVKLVLKMESADPLPRSEDLFFVARYADGSYSGALRIDGGSFRTRVPFFERYGREMTMRFPSPLSLPWNRIDEGRVLADAELWVLRMTGEPYFPPRGPLDIDAEKLGFATLEAAHSDRVSSGWRQKTWLIRPEDLLKWPAWSDVVWLRLVSPVLKERHLDHLKEPLLDRLKNDVRPARLMVDKGMVEEAKDELVRRLDDGLPLNADALIVLMEENEFSNDHWSVRALAQVPDWNDEMQSEGKRSLPDTFEKLAEQAWSRVGAAAGDTPAIHGLAAMAAGRGDVVALRFLARKEDTKRLEKLLEPGIDDPVGWLAKHPVVFDPELKIFREVEK